MVDLYATSTLIALAYALDKFVWIETGSVNGNASYVKNKIFAECVGIHATKDGYKMWCDALQAPPQVQVPLLCKCSGARPWLKYSRDRFLIAWCTSRHKCHAVFFSRSVLESFVAWLLHSHVKIMSSAHTSGSPGSKIQYCSEPPPCARWPPLVWFAPAKRFIKKCVQLLLFVSQFLCC